MIKPRADARGYTLTPLPRLAFPLDEAADGFGARCLRRFVLKEAIEGVDQVVFGDNGAAAAEFRSGVIDRAAVEDHPFRIDGEDLGRLRRDKEIRDLQIRVSDDGEIEVVGVAERLPNDYSIDWNVLKLGLQAIHRKQVALG